MAGHTHFKSRMTTPNHLGGLGFVLFLATLYSIYLLPINFMSGSSSYWLAQTEDITAYLAGFNAFFREPWHWPLFRIESLNWPQGTLATFVDIIPLYSVLLKLFAPQSWFPFNPFGYWVVLCIGLQAVSSWWILREAQINSWTFLIVLTTLLLTFPNWNNRFGHLSLFAHWIMLFAFALVLQEQRKRRLPIWSWFALLLCSFFINIYLFLIISLIFITRWIPQLFHRNCSRLIGSSLVMLVIFIAVLGITMWPLPAATGAVEYGFGVYSLNFLSPFSGGRFLSISPDAFSSEQHFEGFNYLGLGVLVLLTMTLIGITRQYWSKPIHQKNWVWPCSLWCLFLLFVLYAFSNKVYWGASLIYQWSIPEWALPFTGQFRASGRFFWPVAYGLTIFAVVSIHRLYLRRTATVILCVACLLQMADLDPLIHQTRAYLNRMNAPILNLEQWEQLIPPAAQTLYIYPKFKCNQHASFLELQLPFTLFASTHRLNINTAYIARHNPLCGQESIEIGNSQFETSTYLFLNAEYSQETIASFFPKNAGQTCQKIQDVTLCTIGK